MQGEITFDALGKRWTLFLGTEAQCALEEHYDKGFYAIVADAVPMEGEDGAMLTPEAMSDPAMMMRVARKLRISTLVDLAWFGLRKHHRDVAIADVYALVDDLGQARFGELIGKAISAMQDKVGAEEAAREAGGAAPGKPRKQPTRARGATSTR